MRRILTRGAGMCFIAFALLLPFSAPASAASPTPCWQQLMNQWYQGEIKTIFPLDCYHQAIKHLPTDIQVYSSARDDITNALQAAISYDNRVKAAKLAAEQTTTSSSGAPKTPVKLAIPIIKTHGPGTPAKTSASTILNSASPGGSTSFPLPLLILGGLAILLVAAGGVGLLIRRRQGGGPGAGPGPDPA
jgi:hypothetical protein